LTLALSRISVFQNTHAFGISGHDSILDSVMNHLDEMPGTARSTMQVALFGRATEFLAARCARDVATAGRERGKYRIESLNYLGVAADHHAIAPLQSPDAAAGSDIDIMKT